MDYVAAHVPEGTAVRVLRRSLGPPGSDGSSAAVGGDDRAGDVAGFGRGKEGDHAGDLAGLGGPGQQGRGAEGLDAARAAPLVWTGPAAMALTRTPEGLNSAAQERVIAARVALVAP